MLVFFPTFDNLPNLLPWTLLNSICLDCQQQGWVVEHQTESYSVISRRFSSLSYKSIWKQLYKGLAPVKYNLSALWEHSETFLGGPPLDGTKETFMWRLRQDSQISGLPGTLHQGLLYIEPHRPCVSFSAPSFVTSINLVLFPSQCLWTRNVETTHSCCGCGFSCHSHNWI